ncbi:MAG: DNA/RNA non-specific endonuclease [Bacteroidales bacterium]|nr:DNA/RNA non-specific endonuclease [Bacteroidales bacterium]
MKRILIPIALLLATACSREAIPAGNAPEGYSYTFTIEEESRATLDDGGVLWEAGDRVGMFLEGYSGYASIKADLSPKQVTLYSRSEIPAGSYAYAYYPYRSGNNDKTAATITLSNNQDGGFAAAMPMAGIPFPVQETVEVSGTSAQTNGVIRFVNLAAIIDFRVFSTNSAFTSETVKSVTFRANGVNLAGDAVLDLTALSTGEFDDSALELSWSNTVYDNVKVSQSAAVASTSESATAIYMVVAPGTYPSGTITIATDAATYTFEYTGKSLGRNSLKHYNMDLAHATTREAGVVETIMSLPYSEAFTSNRGEFEIEGGTGKEWQFRATYGATVSAYYNSTNHAVQTSIISPWIDLRQVDGATLSFEHATSKYLYNSSNSCDDDAAVYIMKSGDSGWTLLSVQFPDKPSSTYSQFITVSKDISDYAGGKIKVKFEYTSTTSRAGTWEIRNFSCVESEPPVPVVKLGWLELPSYTTSAMNGTTTSSLSDLYLLKHSAHMDGIIQRNYSCLYDPEMYASYWVAYPLCSDHLGSGRTESWGYDPDVAEYKQTEAFPYSYGTGASHPTVNFSDNYYARGHQIPNADRNGVNEMMAQTYYMTNITPQIHHGFNADIWLDLETAVRDLLYSSSCDTVYVVTGAAFRKKGGNETINYIVNTRYDQKQLPVPNYYWKALLKVKWNGLEVTDASAIGFWLPHDDLLGESYDDKDKYVFSVSQLETWTGFDLFANLPAALQSTAEANASWEDFQDF